MRHFVELELGMESGWLKNPDGEATGEENERIKRGAAKCSEKLKRVEEKRPFKTKNARARILMSTSDGGNQPTKNPKYHTRLRVRISEPDFVWDILNFEPNKQCG